MSASIRHPVRPLWRVAPLLVSAAAALAVWASDTNRLLFFWLNRWAESLPDAAWASATVLGDALIGLVLLGLLARSRPDVVWAGLVASLFGALISRGLKAGLPLHRPPAVLDPDSFHLIGPALSNSSFPSGHTLAAFLFAGVLILASVAKTPATRALLLTAAALVGLSRIAVGVHWPIDVLGGAFGGWLAAALGVSLAGRWHWGLGLRAQRTQLALLWLCSVALFFHSTGYASAQWLVLSIAACGLFLIFAYQHDLWRDEATIRAARDQARRLDHRQA